MVSATEHFRVSGTEIVSSNFSFMTAFSHSFNFLAASGSLGRASGMQSQLSMEMQKPINTSRLKRLEQTHHIKKTSKRNFF